MTPAYCEVCGRCFENQYFHNHEGGQFVPFGDFDDSAAKLGYCPGVVGAAWICDEHLTIAIEHAHLPVDVAVGKLRASIGLTHYRNLEGLDVPHLFLDAIGPNRAKVFAIVRSAACLSPTQAKTAIDNLPPLIAKGWPSEFQMWKAKLEACGASVRIAWD